MSSKQAQRASAKKQQSRRQKVAQQRAKAATRASRPQREEPTVNLLDALDIGPEDSLPNGKVKLSAALLKIAGRAALLTGVDDAATFAQIMKIAGLGWNLAVLQQFPDLHPGAAASVARLWGDLDAEARSLVEVFREEKKRQFPADPRLVIEMIEERVNGAPFYSVPNIDPDEQPGAKGRGNVTSPNETS